MVVYKEVQTADEVERPVAERPVTSERAEYNMNVAARVVSFIGGIILALLIIRFVLVLLGANPANGFADFIYSVSHPLVSPFFGLFSYEQNLGTRRFELAALVAMVVYGLLTALLVRLVTLGSRR